MSCLQLSALRAREGAKGSGGILQAAVQPEHRGQTPEEKCARSCKQMTTFTPSLQGLTTVPSSSASAPSLRVSVALRALARQCQSWFDKVLNDSSTTSLRGLGVFFVLKFHQIGSYPLNPDI